MHLVHAVRIVLHQGGVEHSANDRDHRVRLDVQQRYVAGEGEAFGRLEFTVLFWREEKLERVWIKSFDSNGIGPSPSEVELKLSRSKKVRYQKNNVQCFAVLLDLFRGDDRLTFRARCFQLPAVRLGDRIRERAVTAVRHIGRNKVEQALAAVLVVTAVHLVRPQNVDVHGSRLPRSVVRHDVLVDGLCSDVIEALLRRRFLVSYGIHNMDCHRCDEIFRNSESEYSLNIIQPPNSTYEISGGHRSVQSLRWILYTQNLQFGASYNVDLEVLCVLRIERVIAGATIFVRYKKDFRVSPFKEKRMLREKARISTV